MAWTRKYWEMLDHFYWMPQYAGLKSITQSHWVRQGDFVCVPTEMVNKDGPLYRREKKIDDYMAYVRRVEELFNNIFDIVFGILPEEASSLIWGACMEKSYQSPFRSYGLDIRPRYGWTKHSNITQVDGYFLNEDTTLAVEIKFNAKTSLDQLTKYLYLMMNEEIYRDQKLNPHLLYIFNKSPDETFKKQLGYSSDEICLLNPELLLNACKNETVRNFVKEHFDIFSDILKRLVLKGIDYKNFASVLSDFSNKQADDIGGRTLKNLINGLVHEIEIHPLSHAMK